LQLEAARGEYEGGTQANSGYKVLLAKEWFEGIYGEEMTWH
jgi:hypothetical protein